MAVAAGRAVPVAAAQAALAAVVAAVPAPAVKNDHTAAHLSKLFV